MKQHIYQSLKQTNQLANQSITSPLYLLGLGLGLTVSANRDITKTVTLNGNAG